MHCNLLITTVNLTEAVTNTCIQTLMNEINSNDN